MNLNSVIFLVLVLSFGNVKGQNECFQNCRQRSIVEWEKLQARGITSTDSALSCDAKILSNLKGCSFPSIDINKFDGGKFNIQELKGNVVFVHFWFTTCATCIAEMPSIIKLEEENKGKNVKFLAITFNDKNTLEKFFKKRGKFGSIHTYIDQKALESTFCLLSGYPMNFVLDKNGKVVEAWIEENPDSNQQEGFYNKVSMLINNNL